MAAPHISDFPPDHPPTDPAPTDPAPGDPAPGDPAGASGGDPVADLDAVKRDARTRAVTARAGQDATGSGAALMGHVLRDCPPPTGTIVSGFWPLEGEIDVRPLLTALHERGHPVVLPITPRRGNPLTFGLWRPGDALVPERFGTVRPIGPVMAPDFLLVPLLAFDRTGRRLGYGGGFYDRTLASLPGRFALGCAFAAQEVAKVPVGPFDHRLDAVATERGIVIPVPG